VVITFSYPHHTITICIRAVIKCGYYALSAYEVMSILDYYLNLYASLNNAVISICKLNKFSFVTQFTIISHRGSLSYKVIGIWITQRKERKKKKKK
jgi:hypothetical protein